MNYHPKKYNFKTNNRNNLLIKMCQLIKNSYSQYALYRLNETSNNKHNSKLFKIRKFKKVRLKIDSIKSLVYYCILVLFVFNVPLVKCNRPPRFIIEGGQSEIVLRLKESPETPVGTLIYNLRGYDPDNDPLTFGIRQSQDSDIIRIVNVGKNEANIYLAKELDRETKDEYSIVLTLTDNRFENYVTQSFLLLVEDVNDNEPIFLPYQSAIEVPENSRSGIITTLKATDRDEGAYGQVVYYLQELDGDNDVFSISTYQGEGVLRLVGNLDYETKSLYQLRVLAIDRANQGPVNTGTAAILIKVRDVEDQPPEFVQMQAVARIPEDAPIGTHIVRVKAIDGDRGINNRIKYSVEKNDLFSIEEDTGTVFTIQELDREDTINQVNGAYILKIIATEISILQPPPMVKTEVTIIVLDVNDETPTFHEFVYRCEINENAQINTPVNFIDDVENAVSDYDVGNNGTFKLYMDPPNEIFEITPSIAVNEATFLIRVKNSELLDYELQTEMNFTIYAKEVAEPRKWSSAMVQIFVRDQNDNFPEFSQSIYNVTVPENSDIGTIIAKVEAYDEDSGDFGTMGIRYKNLRGGIAHLLQLDPISGTVTIKRNGGEAFDREVISRHYLTVEALDNIGQGNRNTVQLIINIEDVNDNAPIFRQQQYEAKLLENKMSFETPLVLEARDIDMNGTENSQITYEIVEGMFKTNFTIDYTTGAIKPLHEIDFEDLSEGNTNIRNITLMVRARDSGIPTMFSIVPVVVYVQDVNDNAPIFQRAFYSKTIPEDLPGGSPVLEVKAYDRDASSPNNNIVYRIQSGASDKFIISSDTGMIFVAQGASLDPDLTNSKKIVYTMTVLALDGGLGTTQLMSSTTVNITIKDVNNKLPMLTDLPTLQILENTPVGTVIYRVIAMDLDDAPILRYHINSKNSEARTEEGAFVKQSEFDFTSAFELSPIDGILKIIKILDREKLEHIKLAITVEDLAAANGNQIVEAFLNIQIEDENDNNPKFKSPFYKRSITENSKNGVLIANVVAFDIDKNKTITYSLEGNPSMTGLVHLDPQSGEIVVANKIDHEIHQWLNFTVRATDSGYPPRSSLVDVFISVLDENDNNPYFMSTAKNFSISENVPIGTRIGTIQAMDADSGDFGKITFLMDRISSQGKFSVDADTGVLSVADKLDREVKDFYMLVIEAWDNYQFGYLAGESRNAFKQIFINILDENDSPPVVTLPTGCVQITEYHDINEVIATIRGKDADDPSLPNGRLEITITKGNDEDLFDINQMDYWSAQIFAKQSLKNKYGNYTLTISTRDLGVPSHVITKNLEICISDFNDHPPIFVSPLHNTTIRIPENATIGTMIIQIRAVDDDIGANALVKYRLKPDPLGNFRTFEMDGDTGMLYLKEHLDRERQKIYEIRIEAYDQGVPTSLSSDLDLTIYVRNVNDYEPQFLIDQIYVNFTEHTDPGVEKVKLPDTIDKDEVDDLDDPPSSVCYFIIKGNENNLFSLDPETHILLVLKELDREIQNNHTLYIRATEDCSENPKNLTYKTFENTEHDLLDIYPLMQVARRNGQHNEEIIFDRYKHSRNLRSVNNIEETNDVDILMDNTIVRVVVRVIDINDNPPKFRSKVFTGGFTTNTNFGIKFMKVEANDPDDGVNAVISYYQVGEIRQTLSEGLENVQKTLFLIDRKTGEIQLNFDPQKGMKGYFDFMIVANDTDGLRDTAHVFIYLLREDQKVRFVFRRQPAELRDHIHLFRSILSNVTNAIVNVDEFRVHENKDGSVDKTKTDLYLHLVNKEVHSILEVSDVLSLIDEHIETLDNLFKEFNVLDIQPAEAEMLVGAIGKAPMFVWLIFSNVFIATLLVVTLALCVSQRNGYKRQLRAAKVNIFSHPISDITERDPTTRVPNTNKHSVEGSNPIWLKAYENEWFKNDDNISQNGPDSLDDNFLAGRTNGSIKNGHTGKLFDQSNDLNRHFNVYHQIDKITNNAQILAKRLETTEL